MKLERILVAVDFTETSDAALAYAIDLAQRLGAAVTVLHAYQVPVFGFPEGAYITAANVAAQISAEAQAGLDAVKDRYKDRGVSITTVLRNGVPWEEINGVAGEVQADLIVIGTHGRRGLARALLGSVAENVIRTATTPILVLHGPRGSSPA